jgi:chorismate mutase
MDKELNQRIRELIAESSLCHTSMANRGECEQEIDELTSAILKLFEEREDAMGKEIIKLKEDLKKCHDCDYYCLSLQQEVQYLEGVAESFATEVKYYKERENIHLNFAKEVIQRKEKNENE